MKKVGQIWSIVKVDRYGKVEMGYQSITDIEIKEGKTLGAYLEENEKEKQELRKEIKELKEQLKDTAFIIEKLKSATKESFTEVLNEINKEKFL